MVYAYLQKGDNTNAQEQYSKLKGIQGFYPMNLSAAAYPLAAIPTRIALENKDWSMAANLTHQSTKIDWDLYPWHNAVMHFGRALGKIHTADYTAAKQEIDTLAQLKEDLIAMNDPMASNQIDQIKIQITAAGAWLAFKQEDLKEGLNLMQQAAIMENNTSKHPMTPGDVLPMQELLGDMLLDMNKYAEALVAYEKNLLDRPNRFNGVYGAAVAAKNSGNTAKAKEHFENLMVLNGDVETDRKELSVAKEFLSQI